jgi:hypothetical protein
VWWIDVLVLAAMVAAWNFIPWWVALTSSFFRRRYGPDLGDGRVVVMVYRVAIALIALLALVDLGRRAG